MKEQSEVSSQEPNMTTRPSSLESECLFALVTTEMQLWTSTDSTAPRAIMTTSSEQVSTDTQETLSDLRQTSQERFSRTSIGKLDITLIGLRQVTLHQAVTQFLANNLKVVLPYSSFTRIGASFLRIRQTEVSYHLFVPDSCTTAEMWRTTQPRVSGQRLI